ncbi:MAG: site-2 protease family protein [Bacilli bacterium]|nr:site-2 protease family protein [Bacilli bacterium]
MKIKIHFSLALIFFVFIFTGFYLEFLLFFLIILLHECGHFLMAKIFKQKVSYCTFTILGGVLKMEISDISRIKQVLIFSAGIIVNLIIIQASFFIGNDYLHKLIFNYNLLLIIFNFLPIHPLDGFQILQVIFSGFKAPLKEFRILSIISYLSLTGLAIYIFINRYGLAAWIVLVFLIYHNINLEINQSNIVLKKIITNYRNQQAKLS